MTAYKRKLIEVALPLEAINKESAREKSIRHGHPSTLHLWWARRPLAACRAVLFAQLVDDPSAHPDQFPTVEAQDADRQRLFRIIEDLVKWENSTNETVLGAARAEIVRSCDGALPAVLDPFCGGGSIPLEAQRLGLEAHASDLNPVPVLITKALIEIPPRWAGHAPVHPEAELRGSWQGATGLAEDVRRYGAWMHHQAEQRIGHLYPEATLPDGRKATVIAWIWARTVTCPNPACGATMPLARSFWLGKKKGKEAWLRPVVEGSAVRFEIGHGAGGPSPDGTVGRTGATCLICDAPTPLERIRLEGRAGRMGSQLAAIVAGGDRARLYLPAADEHIDAADLSRPDGIPETELPEKALGFRVQAYGMTRHADLFTNRQLVALTTFSDLVGEARAHVEKDALSAGLTPDDATAYAAAIATYLAFCVDRVVNEQSTICTWASNGSKEHLRSTFARQALPMTWDFGEGNLFARSTGNFEDSYGRVATVLEHLPAHPAGRVDQRDAAAHLSEGRPVVSTDPPYYDNIGYADLSDFFYVWLRRSLHDVYPELFATVLTPKSAELVATPYRFDGSRDRADAHFEEGFVRTFTRIREQHAPGFPITVFYAFKQAEDDGQEGALASTGWETMLEGLSSAGLAVTGTWPMRTERSGRSTGIGTNALASSILLVCRPREIDAGITDRRGFLVALKAELPHALRDLQQGNIAPVDLAQASIGPGMATFSRYAKVVEPGGEPMRVRTALGLINQVLDEVLAEQEGDFDPDTRWAVKWFEQFGFEEGDYGVAEVLATARNTSIAGLAEAGVLLARAGKVRLLARDELPGDWDPAADGRVPVWEVTSHLVKRLESQGESSAGALLRQVGGLGETARELAYRLYSICEKRNWSKHGQLFNALVTSWPEIVRASRLDIATVADTQDTLL